MRRPWKLAPLSIFICAQLRFVLHCRPRKYEPLEEHQKGIDYPTPARPVSRGLPAALFLVHHMEHASPAGFIEEVERDMSEELDAVGHIGFGPLVCRGLE